MVVHKVLSCISAVAFIAVGATAVRYYGETQRLNGELTAEQEAHIATMQQYSAKLDEQLEEERRQLASTAVAKSARRQDAEKEFYVRWNRAATNVDGCYVYLHRDGKGLPHPCVGSGAGPLDLEHNYVKYVAYGRLLQALFSTDGTLPLAQKEGLFDLNVCVGDRRCTLGEAICEVSCVCDGEKSLAPLHAIARTYCGRK